MEIYQVGGAVRDALLGLPVKDRDYVVVGATPEQMEALGYRPVGRDFPVFLHPESGEEYALARTERKTAPGYAGFAFHAAPDVTLEEDLRRRDLTINAMALDGEGRLIDPYGGRRDLEARILRHVSPAFVEDPVRILRLARFFARFAPLGFTVADETLALMREMVASGEVDALVPERVWSETERALAEAEPRRYFELLRQCGALAVIFPEIDALFGVPQPPRHHPEIDCGLHVMMVLEQAARLSEAPRIRFAALLHDLGKGTTPSHLWPSHHGHEARSARLAGELCQRLRAPRAFRELAVLVARYHTHGHRAFELKPATVLELFQALDAFRRPERLDAFLICCEADSRGRLGFEEKPYPQAAHLRALFEAARAIDGGTLAREGLRGADLARQLKRRRIAAIAAVRDG